MSATEREPRSRRVVLDAKSYVDGVRAGDRGVLGRAITLVESTQPAHEALAQEVLLELLPYTGKSSRVGISGSPGVGKSTFIESFGLMLVRENHRVAVLAVDPTSPRTGGSILGDKTRMTLLSQEPRAFIRPSPTVGSLGGVARRTREAMLLCEAAGYDVVLVETVGVGQSETAVSEMVDFFLVLMLASAGDELQGIKRGILELADTIAINKSDSETSAAVRRAVGDYEHALRIVKGHEQDWTPRVVRCSGLTGEGLDDIWRLVLEHQAVRTKNQTFAEHRQHQLVTWVWSLVEDTLLASLHDAPEVRREKTAVEAEVLAGRLTPALACKQILKAFFEGGGTARGGR